jgi:hypothetical protein
VVVDLLQQEKRKQLYCKSRQCSSGHSSKLPQAQQGGNPGCDEFVYVACVDCTMISRCTEYPVDLAVLECTFP